MTITQDTLQDLARHLSQNGLTVTVEYPGVVSVWAEDLVDHPDYTWWFGTANATWQGDLNNGKGEYLQKTLDTGVPSTEQNMAVVAQGICDVLNACEDAKK